jgi:hypothetical protein
MGSFATAEFHESKIILCAQHVEIKRAHRRQGAELGAGSTFTLNVPI